MCNIYIYVFVVCGPKRAEVNRAGLLRRRQTVKERRGETEAGAEALGTRQASPKRSGREDERQRRAER